MMGGYQTVGMGVGVCASCRQRNELHQHPRNGAGVCEGCLEKDPCRNCNKWDVLKPDPNDGKPVCSECITKPESGLGKSLQQRSELVRAAGVGEPQPPREIAMTQRRQDLLDFIVTNASPEWLNGFVKQKLIEYERKLVNENKWIDHLEAEPNERILLRMATELGYRQDQPRNRDLNYLLKPPAQPEPHVEQPPAKGKKKGRRARQTTETTRPAIEKARLATRQGTPGTSSGTRPETGTPPRTESRPPA